jgi:hypothetical protein
MYLDNDIIISCEKTEHLPRQARDTHREDSKTEDVVLGCVSTVSKNVFLRHLCIKCIILPRQARDENRESSGREWGCGVFRRRTGAGHHQ